jgi:hypothetical protein
MWTPVPGDRVVVRHRRSALPTRHSSPASTCESNRPGTHPELGPRWSRRRAALLRRPGLRSPDAALSRLRLWPGALQKPSRASSCQWASMNPPERPTLPASLAPFLLLTAGLALAAYYAISRAVLGLVGHFGEVALIPVAAGVRCRLVTPERTVQGRSPMQQFRGLYPPLITPFDDQPADIRDHDVPGGFAGDGTCAPVVTDKTDTGRHSVDLPT